METLKVRDANIVAIAASPFFVLSISLLFVFLLTVEHPTISPATTTKTIGLYIYLRFSPIAHADPRAEGMTLAPADKTQAA
jgi:hypothetical protein